MPKRNRTTLRINLLNIQAQFIYTVKTLTSKCLVNLPDIHVLLIETSLLEHNRDSSSGSHAHHERRDADDGGLDELSDDGLIEALGGAAFHEEHGGGAVGDLGGVACVDGTVFGEGGADFTERLGGYALSDAVVLGYGDGLFFLCLGVCPLDL